MCAFSVPNTLISWELVKQFQEELITLELLWNCKLYMTINYQRFHKFS